MKKRLLCTCALIAFACKQSPKDARQELAKLNVPFTADEFVMRCARGPTTLIDTFLVAGADPNVVVVEGQETVTPLMAAAVAGRSRPLRLRSRRRRLSVHAALQEYSCNPPLLHHK